VSAAKVRRYGFRALPLPSHPAHSIKT
jgi:hypothetical protein